LCCISIYLFFFLKKRCTIKHLLFTKVNFNKEGLYCNKYFLSCINLKVKSKPITPSSASSKTITTSSTSSKTIRKTTTSKVREKKVYSLPGQKHDPLEQVSNLPYLVHRIHKPIWNLLTLILVFYVNRKNP